jgi:Mn-containing catalase
LGGAIHNKKEQMNYLHNRLDMVMNVLENINPEEAGVEEIDRLLTMLDDIEVKCKQFRYDWSE